MTFENGFRACLAPRMAGDSVAGLLADFWAWRLEQSPEFATMTGSKLHNHRLEQFTVQRFQDDFATCKTFLERADALVEVEEGAREEMEFFKAEVETFVEGFPHKGFYFPINYMEGVQVDFQRLAEWATLSQEKDFQDVVARCKCNNLKMF